MLGHSLNLSPSPQLGHFYIVPYQNKNLGVAEGQFQIGYKAYIQLALRTGQYKTISVIDVKKGELKFYDRLTDNVELNFIENDLLREKEETIGYVAYFELVNGFRKTLYWSKEKMEIHANKYSKAFSLDSYKKLKENKIPQAEMWKYSSYWYKDFDGMAFKTMIRQLISKWGIMSSELEVALKNDMAIIRDGGNIEYVDNSEEPVEKPNFISIEKQEEVAKLVGNDGNLWDIVAKRGHTDTGTITEEEYGEIIKELKSKTKKEGK